MSADTKNRRLQLASELEKPDYKKLIRECSTCKRFLLDYGGVIFKDPLLCHDWAVVFTDGSCPGNGSKQARAGIGIAAGEEDFRQTSVPWNSIDAIPRDYKRTNQRAELFAALAGLKKGLDVHMEHLKAGIHCSAPKRLILATDSEYVVKCLTVWFPGLKNKGSDNFGIIDTLHKRVIQVEKDCDIEIFFLHIPREANYIADKLARDAARRDDIAVEASTLYNLMAQLSITPPAPSTLEDDEFPGSQFDERYYMEQAIDDAMAPLTRALSNCNSSLEISIKEALHKVHKTLGESYELQNNASGEKVVFQTLIRAAQIYTDGTSLGATVYRQTLAEKFDLSLFSEEIAQVQEQAISRAAKIIVAPLHRANAVVRKIMAEAMLAAMHKYWNGAPIENKGVLFQSQN